MKKYITIAVLLVLFTLVFTYPAIFHLSDKIIGDGGDSSLLMGWQYVAETQVEKNVFPFSWTNYWRYPVGIDFSVSYDSVLFISLGLFLYRFLDNPVLVFNLSVLFTIFLNGVFSYLFFEKISKSKLLGLTGAVIYGFSFYVLARLGGHMNLIFTGSFPFLLYSLITFGEKKGSRSSFLLIGLATILIFLSSLQYLLIALGATMFILPLFILLYPKVFSSYLRIIKDNPIQTAATFLIVLFVFVFFNASNIVAFLNGTLTTLSPSLMYTYSPHPVNFILSNTYTRLLINSVRFLTIDIGGIEGSLFIGFVEIFVFCYFTLARLNKKLKVLIGTSALTMFILSLGCSSTILPYCYLYNFFPFKGVAEVGRFYIIFYLFLTIGVIYVLKSLTRKSRWILLVIFALIIFERLPSNFYLSDSPANETFIKVVRSLNSNAVLDLPIINQDASSQQKANYDLYSIFYKKPIVNGYIQWLGETSNSEKFLNSFSTLECEQDSKINNEDINSIMLPSLINAGIKTIVVHKYVEPFGTSPDACDLAFSNINLFLYESGIPIKKMYEDEQTAVFQLQ